MSKYKYREDEILSQLKEYVDSTYSQHYVAKDIQVIDIWESLGSLDTTCRDTAIKYLSRYGKKEGKNKKDLLKAMHYIMLLMYTDMEQVDPVEEIILQLDSDGFDLDDFELNLNINDAYERTDKKNDPSAW
jgi:hypothetical protein